MKTVLNTMKRSKIGIPANVVAVFESIVRNNEMLRDVKSRDECDAEFVKAMEDHLTSEQRYRLYEQNGACKGTGQDKERKAFALKHSGLPLDERLKLFTDTFGGNAVLNDDNTITVTFVCSHGYYRRTDQGKPISPPVSTQSYFEKCAGGRLYEYQKTLGIKLRIESVDVSALTENPMNPVVFTFSVVD